MNLLFKIKNCIFASLLFLPHVGAAKEILLNAVPLTMPQHLMRHYCFMRKIELGEKNNLLTLTKINPEKVKHVKHEFLCDCGVITNATLDNVRRGNVKSCGCLNKSRIMPPKVKKSEIGEKHNMLTLIKIDKTKPYAKGRHVFLCECGNECTPESLYWAGFLAADGCVQEKNENNKKISIGLKKSDIGHIEKFRKFIGSDTVIREKKHSFDISVSSVKMANDLRRFGVTPRKSLNYSPPDFCLNSPDFWRGMIDGDGCIGDKNGNIHIGLCGSKDTVFVFYNWVSSFTDVKAKPFERTPNFWAFRTSCSHAQKTIQKLYENGGISLDRKTKIVHDFMLNKKCKYIYI